MNPAVEEPFETSRRYVGRPMETVDGLMTTQQSADNHAPPFHQQQHRTFPGPGEAQPSFLQRTFPGKDRISRIMAEKKG